MELGRQAPELNYTPVTLEVSILLLMELGRQAIVEYKDVRLGYMFQSFFSWN